MENIKKSLTRFLTENNAWIIVVSIVIICFFRVMTFSKHLSSMVYLHRIKWMLFLKVTGLFLLIFSLIILFCFFRKRLSNYLSKSLYYGLWVMVFVLYPVLLGFVGFVKTFFSFSMESEVLGVIGIVLSVIGIFISPTSKLKMNFDLSKWWNKITSETIVIGIFILFSFYMSFHLIMENFESSFLMMIIQNLILVSVYYLFYWINHYYLVNHIYKQKGVIYYIFSFIGLEILFFIPLILLQFYLPALKSYCHLELGEYWIGENPPFTFWSVYLNSILFLLILSIPLTILIQWFKQSNRIDNLNREKSETELSLLKQQINPHFFFNTLNNVYSMSLTKDNNTSEAILQLSDLMRYVIYKGQESKVMISEEVKYIEDYLDLQKLRLHKNFDLIFDKNIENKNYEITPLLFVFLIENAFKHGIEGAEYDSYLHLSLIQNKNKIVFSCKNSMEGRAERTTKGMGMENLKRRLELLYPEGYNLEVNEGDSDYEATLTIYH